jgi:PTH1 family peptidyl-tRNA hydrolase
MKVVVGLGNPGSRYEGTRHNVGFAVIDLLAQSSQAARSQRRFEAELIEVFEDGQKILLVKPLTFMNVSGRCVRQIVDFYEVPLGDLLIVCDDINLELGRLRARARGTHGGHNGLRDIQNHLGTAEYSRLRIGVGAPAEQGADAAAYVLDRFRPGERPIIADAILRASQAVGVWLRQGIEACMNQYNARAG